MRTQNNYSSFFTDNYLGLWAVSVVDMIVFIDENGTYRHIYAHTFISIQHSYTHKENDNITNCMSKSDPAI